MQSSQDQPFPKLSRAPVTEGLIDFRLRPLQPIALEQLSQLDAQLNATYTIKKDIRTLQAAFNMEAEAGQQIISSEQLIGYRYESKEAPFIFQARIDGFTVSRLAPYSTWDELLAETKRLWGIYNAIVGNTTVVRIATRYINKIHFPGSAIDFDEYLTAGPIIPKKLPQDLIEFLMRTVIPFDDNKSILVLIQASEAKQPSSPGFPVLLDIDVFHEGAYDSKDGQFWQLLEDLHILKNRAFFASITEKTLELLK